LPFSCAEPPLDFDQVAIRGFVAHAIWANRVSVRLRGAREAYYRLYMLAGPEGRFVGFEEIEAEDDVEAVRLAEVHIGPRPLELWCGKRKVKALPAADRDG